MTTEQLRHLNTIVEHYGSDHQQRKAIEECAELTQAICKYEACLDGVEKIVDEIADVKIMLAQLEIIFDCFGEVEARIEYKINRQLERIKRGE